MNALKTANRKCRENYTKDTRTFFGERPACRLLFSLFNCISKIYRRIKRDCLVTVALPSSIDIRRCLSMVSMSI